MKNWREYFKDKKITVMGLGLLGRGVGDIKFLSEAGAKEIIVTDLKNENDLQESFNELKDMKNIRFVLGEHRLEDFKDRDLIIKSAGVLFDSIYIKEAEKNNIPVEMSTALFAKFFPGKIIGITGTRGKSTVTHLIYEIIKNEGKVFLGGNVKGVSTISFLKEAKENDWAVLELDSWQLQGFGTQKISPHIAVFTTLLPDHQNYYKNNMELYFEDKANIFKFQKEKDFLISGSQVAPLIVEKYESVINSKIIVADESKVPEDWKIKIPGTHNKYNISLAIAVAKALEIDMSVVKEAVENFSGVPGRLELVRDYKGIKIWNDTTATTPDATLAGLRALGSEIVLIMGGADKNLDMTKLFQEIPEHVRALILIPGTGSTRIEGDLIRLGDANVDFNKVNNLREAINLAVALAPVGGNILFSPGFASFGMFKNEYDRGDQFNELVKNLR